MGAHDDRRVLLFEQQQTTYRVLQGVLLGLEQPGWALGVAAQAKGRALLYRLRAGPTEGRQLTLLVGGCVGEQDDQHCAVDESVSRTGSQP